MTGDRHLTDEDLSDLLDGVAGADVERHAEGCPSCASRLDGWRDVSARLSAATQVRPDRREDAVAAAMAARPPGAARGRRGRVLSGVAAAAAVLSAIGFGLSNLSLSSSAKSSGNAASTAGPEVTAPAVGGQVVSADLGALGSPSAVTAAVDHALAAFGAYGTSSQSAPASEPASAQGDSHGAPGSAASAGSAAGCPDPARFLTGSPPRLLLSAAAVYRSTPARVYAYEVSGQRRVLVVDARTCALLVEVPA